jgi:hypothetical protein
MGTGAPGPPGPPAAGLELCVAAAAPCPDTALSLGGIKIQVFLLYIYIYKLYILFYF